MLTDVKSSITTSYSYNHAGRLSNVTVGGVQKGGYIYNAVGQLVSRTVSNTTPSGTVHYVHDLNGNVIAETDGSGSTVREYVWIEHRNSGDGITTGAATPLAVVADVDTATPETYFVHPDHLDRPAMMTDASASIVWNATFLPFGSVHQITGTAANDNRFPGQWYQLESGLHYNWHRHYDPDLGRYTQPDPLGLVDGPVRYNYALGSPLIYTDPVGLDVTVTRYTGGNPFGHIGIGVNSNNTNGFYPAGGSSLGLPFGRNVPGQMLVQLAIRSLSALHLDKIVQSSPSLMNAQEILAFTICIIETVQQQFVRLLVLVELVHLM